MLKKITTKWYYVRGLNSVKWRKKFYYKYGGKWLWSEELLEKDIPHIDRLLHELKPVQTPLLTYLVSKKNNNSKYCVE